MLDAGITVFVLDEVLVDRQDGEWVELLVGLEQFSPRVVAVERQGVGQTPRELDIPQGPQGRRLLMRAPVLIDVLDQHRSRHLRYLILRSSSAATKKADAVRRINSP